MGSHSPCLEPLERKSRPRAEHRQRAAVSATANEQEGRQQADDDREGDHGDPRPHAGWPAG